MKKLGVVAIIVVVIIALGAYFVTRIPNSPFEGVDAQIDSVPLEQAEYVARLGDCVACHSVPGGKPFAGGLKMGTPLGAIYSTNITPDKDTGIGSYTLAQFDNAVRRGVARDGRRLYPAMPYPSYAKMSDDDVKTLYAYFMKHVEPVKQADMASEIPSPWNQRWPLALWNLAFLKDQPYQPKAGQDEAWNRGAYIVQGLGHCGSCHTERGAAFQEVALDDGSADYLAGALLDGWKASSLRQDPNSGLGRWSEAEIAEFLKTGRNAHATVFGSMLDAYNNSTQFMSDADLAGVAKYLKSLPANKEAGEQAFAYDDATLNTIKSGDLSALGASLFLKQCAFCHSRDGKGRGKNLPPLAGNPTVLDEDPSSLINLMLNGAGRIVTNGVPDSYRMPPFRVLLDDKQIADLATFMRSSWGNKRPAVTPEQVKALRESTDAHERSCDRTKDGGERRDDKSTQVLSSDLLDVHVR